MPRICVRLRSEAFLEYLAASRTWIAVLVARNLAGNGSQKGSDMNQHQSKRLEASTDCKLYCNWLQDIARYCKFT